MQGEVNGKMRTLERKRKQKEGKGTRGKKERKKNRWIEEENKKCGRSKE